MALKSYRVALDELPWETRLGAFRSIRDQIRAKFREFVDLESDARSSD